MTSKTVSVSIVVGVTGIAAIYLDDYRIVGSKPWGGGDVLYEATANRDDILKALGLV